MTDQLPRNLPASRLLVAAAVLLAASAAGGARAASNPPSISYVFPPGGRQGTTVEATVGGVYLKAATAVRITGAGVTATVLPATATDDTAAAPRAAKAKKPKTSEDREEETIRIAVAIAPDAPPGLRDLRVVTPGGVSNRYRFLVGTIREMAETEPNSKPAEAQPLGELPVVVNGQILSADRDVYRFRAGAGETIVCEAKGQAIQPFIPDAVPGWLQATLAVCDADGRELAYADDFRFKPDPVLIWRAEKDGEYLVRIEDALYRGRDDFVYRLTVGALPTITDVYPLGGRRGTTVPVALTGANLDASSLDVALPADAPATQRVTLTRGSLATNGVPFAAGDLQETSETEDNGSPEKANRVAPGTTVNGRIQTPGDVDCFVFAAEEKQTLVIDVRARRLDSPLDSVIVLRDAKGKQLAANDDTVDPACQWMTHHADSQLVHTFAAAGDYTVTLRDIQGKGGAAYAYRLSIAAPQPDFALRILPDNPRIAPGDTLALTADAVRIDGFDGEIALALDGLPPGFTVRGAVIPAGQSDVRFTVTAPSDLPPGELTPTLSGTAEIEGRTVTRRATPAEEVEQAFSYKHRLPTEEFLVSIVEAPPFALTTDLAADQVVEIPQGGEATVTVIVARRGGAKGAVRLAADTPPKGLNVRAASIPNDKDRATVKLVANRRLAVGLAQNVILTGTMRVGKQSASSVAPAVPIRVVAPAPPAAAPAAPTTAAR